MRSAVTEDWARASWGARGERAGARGRVVCAGRAGARGLVVCAGRAGARGASELGRAGGWCVRGELGRTGHAVRDTELARSAETRPPFTHLLAHFPHATVLLTFPRIPKTVRPLGT